MRADDLRRLAKRTGFDVGTLEKDYALTWLLNGIYSDDSGLRNVLVFKGGTAIRKVYFPEWRLSEDLDFTMSQKVEAPVVKHDLEEVFASIAVRSKITYSLRDFYLGEFSITGDAHFLGNQANARLEPIRAQ